MESPNDITAEYYETANQYLKNETVLNQELDLITRLVSQKAKILDIGCGTGRHLIPLAKSGYLVTGIDNSAGMLAQLQKKYPDTDIKQADINKIKLGTGKYDLIIMFWNTFNEIALTEGQAGKLLNNCYQALKLNSRLLINIDDSSMIDPEELDFDFDIMGAPSLHYSWKVSSYYPRLNTTICTETITLPGKVISAQITQRWWSYAQISELAKKTGFKVELEHISCNNELYLILSRNGK